MKYNTDFLKIYLNNYLSENKDNNFLSEYIHKIPDRFYRFRTCKQVEFESIDQNYIWLSLASEFYDVKDSTIKYNLDSQREAIFDIYLEWLPYIMKNEMSSKKHGIAFSNLVLNKNIINEYKQNIIDNNHVINNNKLRIYLLSKGLKSNQANIIISHLDTIISSEAAKEKADQIIENFKIKMQELKDFYYVSCFTESYENDNLWETYADKYSGFCIEYDFNPERKKNLKDLLYNFAPMVYEERKAINLIDIFSVAKKHYCGEIYDKSIIHDIDITMNLHSRTKGITYDHEKEWRLYQKIDTVENRKLNFPYISKIILGKDIKARNKSRLINLAIKHDFEVYQQEYNVFTSSFTYYRIDKT